MTLLFTMKARFETLYIDAAIRSKRRHFTKNFSDPLVVSIRSTSASEAQALHTFKVEVVSIRSTSASEAQALHTFKVEHLAPKTRYRLE